MITFHELAAKWVIRPIPHCAGRFVIRAPVADLSPAKLLGPDVEIREFHVPAARDTVLVARIGGGGLISYRRPDGTHLHTLNTTEGFQRKLLDLGIEMEE
jgi:hypothetical protein